MAYYEIGYKKPPKEFQFKSGQSANPSGQRKASDLRAIDIVDRALNETVQYRSGDKVKRATKMELAIKSLIAKALKGDANAAVQLLRLREYALKKGDVGPEIVIITGGLPDNPSPSSEPSESDRGSQDPDNDQR